MRFCIAIILSLICPITFGLTDTIRVLVLLPEKKGTFLFPFGMERTGAAVAIAAEDIKSEGILGDKVLKIDYRNTKCNDVFALGTTSEYLLQKNYSAIIGPQCSGVCRHVGRLAAYHNLPCFTGVCQDTEMLNKNVFKTLTRFLGTFDKAGLAVKGLLEKFGWNRFGVIAQKHTDKIWFYTRDAVMEMAEANDFVLSIQRDYDVDKDNLRDILTAVRAVARVIVLAVRGETLRTLMLLAHDLGMTKGEYMFICVYYYPQKNTFGDISWKQNDIYDRKAEDAYKALIFVSYYTPKTSRYRIFEEDVKNKSAALFNYVYAPNEELPYPASILYEAMYMYAISLNTTLTNGEDPTNGQLISTQLWGKTYSLITGNVSLNENGDRQQGFKIEQIETGNEFLLREIGNFFTDVGTYQGSPDEAVRWPGGGNSPPRDTPVCGYSGEFCRQGLTETEKMHVLIGTFVGVVIIVVFLSIIIQKVVVRKVRNQMTELFWKIHSHEIILTRKSLFSLSKISIKDGVESQNHFTGTTGTYKGVLVMIKKFNEVNAENSMDIKELRQLRELDHTNVAKLLGFCIETNNVFSVTEYCQKGSLMDILENEDINLDWDFKYCLILDIMRGLEYIFNSAVRYHANLKSSNCVVDSRFVLKLTDFGPRSWLITKDRCSRDLLWTAPEALRNQALPTTQMKQSKDIYSLAIILHEVIQRQGPYGIEELEKTPDDIINLVLKTKYPLFRPKFEPNTCPSQLECLIKECWDEQPLKRPTLKDVLRDMKEISNTKTKGDNFFDNLLKRMEQYANNLEGLVEQRTSQYLQEKRKTEDLLYRLLPKSIAHQIQAQGSVEPEHYDSVTIMFSDIVHFTSLSAESSPMEIVAMLNELYSSFDDIIDGFDVYKVETIGDAYMCVSGLPQRNTFHFEEVAKMSIAIMRMTEHFVIRHRPDRKLELRIGIHTGPCVAGVVGLKMPRYCLFGDTVNTASRMESTSEAYKIQISGTTSEMLQASCNETMRTTVRGEVSIKGKGSMTTSWLHWKENKSSGDNE